LRDEEECDVIIGEEPLFESEAGQPIAGERADKSGNRRAE
jgi:hypothetical protein